MLIKRELARRLVVAVEEAQRRELLPAVPLPAAVIERPQNLAHGDFASNLPMRLARIARCAPMDIACQLIPLIRADDLFEEVQLAPPGFINFVLKSDWLTQQVEAICIAGSTYGNLDIGAGDKVQVEYVSVNPTGPIHVGHGRGAVLGSALAMVLATAGYDVTQEYYVNDAGSQMESFYRSVYVRHAQALGRDIEMPSGGYMGQYMVEMGMDMAAEYGDQFLRMPEAQAVNEIGAVGLERMLDAIRSDLESVGITFDVWFREASLYRDGQYEKAMELLRKGGYLVQREGATWFSSTSLGYEKDNVLIRRTGKPTYFASDAAYHYNKFVERGFKRVINIWGADHQGHVPRMQAVIGALGVPKERLHVIIGQMVTLKRGSEVLKVSKRSGELVTLQELVSEVGADACRYFFLARSPDGQMDFDMELAKKESADNPVYYVQYAHARIASILRNAREQGIDWVSGDVTLLHNDAELALIRKMVLLPDLVEAVSTTLKPHYLPQYATELATAFHVFYQQCRVISNKPGDRAIMQARLKLVEAARIVLARSLALMGMSAPDRM